MKAIGLNIILAQAGFYTASKSFTYYPYRYLFTRILNNDNIFKGESSFAVEMNELRSILKRVNKNSLVLGDELCSGTENISAQSIFASTVIKLSRMNSSFIFATHLHQLNDMKCITELENVKSFHLAVEFNKETGELIYDRRMKEGNGPTIYGLEVCKAMDLDKDFIEMADAIRRDILNLSKELLPVHKSKYNAKVIVNDCEVCDQKAEDVHHIKFQCSADGDNMIAGYIDKNTESNLVPLCKKCHNNVHHGNLEIRGYIQTSSGIKLDYSYASPKEKASKRKKYSQENIELIKDLYKDIQSKARLIEVLDKNHLLSISQGTLNKILKNEY
jgi:DNA mismatch repair protein MutS